MVADYVGLKEANCKNCYRCIRNCPVQAIAYADHQAHILDEACVVCGRCFVACPQNAKEIRNDVPRAKKLIASGHPVYASLAPSFVARYEGMTMRSMEKALQHLGFAGASETALGATVVKNQYDALLTAEEQDIIISSCCPSVTMLFQKHFPEALQYLAPVLSPMLVHCAMIKEEYPEAKTVFIGPCIAKKVEAESCPGMVDCVLTFEDLSTWFEEAGITPEPFPETPGMGRARLFPASGGILKSMHCANNAYAYLAVDGVERCIHATRDILAGNMGKCFIEMSICSGGCINGPGMDTVHDTPLRSVIAINAYAGEKDFPVLAPACTLQAKPVKADYKVKYVVAEKDILEVLRKTGKTNPENELNCGFCGYPTCRDKARAVVLGRADLSMCLPYLKEKAETFSGAIITNMPNAILVLDERLHVQQLNEAALRLFKLSKQKELLGQSVSGIMDPDIFLEARDTEKSVLDRRAFFEDIHRHVEQTVIYDANFHIYVAIIRDVTEMEKARCQKESMRNQTVLVADEVVAKQMRVVQEIASLLGETTAETKIALTRLKDSVKDG